MASGKDPAVLFYTSDFLSAVSLMDMRERGQYITLLCLQRERGHLTMQEIKRAVKTPSSEVMSKFQQDEDGKYFNVRMDKEIAARAAHCLKQKANIEKRWNKKKDTCCMGVGIPDGIPDGNTVVLPLGNGNGNGNGNGSISVSTPEDLFSGELLSAVESWLRYKQEKRQKYKPEGLRNLLSEIRNNAEKYGDGAVAEVIRVSMASGYQGIVFDRLGKGGQRQIPQQRIVQHGDAPGEFERRAMERMMQETPKGGWRDET